MCQLRFPHIPLTVLRPLLCGIAVLGLTLRSLAAPQGTTTRISVDSYGSQANGQSSFAYLSADGRFAAFSSLADNLVPGDTNGALDAFVHDLLTGQSTRISVDSAGVQGNGLSHPRSLSADGRYVAFTSEATNLVPGDTNGSSDVFVRDCLGGLTTCVSVDPGGNVGNSRSEVPSVSADGHYVAFGSQATNLVFPDANGGYSDVLVQDRWTGVTTRVSVSSSGAQGSGHSAEPSISEDGRYVAFRSGVSTLVAGDTNGAYDIFVHDRLTAETTRISVSSTGAQGNKDCGNYPSISADGRSVTFYSEADNLVAGDTNGALDVFVHDRLTGQTICASVNAAGLPGNSHSYGQAMSADGRHVAFLSLASDLVTNNLSGGGEDVFVRDLQARRTSLVSVDSAGVQGNSVSRYPTLSGEGRFVAFHSAASNLVAGDTNGEWDVFVHDRQDTTPVVYCTAKVNSLGCMPTISGIGTASASHATSFLVFAADVISGSSGMLIYGISGPDAAPLQGGYLCVKSPIQRTSLQSSGGSSPPPDCSGTFRVEFNDLIAGGADPTLVAGQEVWTQYWYRDSASPGGSGLSDGLDFLIGP